MDRRGFEQLVAAAIDSIPKRFQSHFDNVAFVIEDDIRPHHAREHALMDGDTLLGLYEGIPPTERGSDYQWVLPDKVTIFQKPIEAAGQGDPEQIRRLVRDTVLHEVAHYFGMDEDAVEGWERERNSS